MSVHLIIGGNGINQIKRHSFVEIDHEIDHEIYPIYAVVSFWQKNVHKYWLTAERTKPV